MRTWIVTFALVLGAVTMTYAKARLDAHYWRAEIEASKDAH